MNTSTSPWVYVVYTNISATDGCASTIGNTYDITTLSYAPSDLRTIGLDYAPEGTTSVSVGKESWDTINYANLFPNWQNCTSVAFSPSNPIENMRIIVNNIKHCHPILQDSPALGLIDPAWARCNQKIAMVDPPRALTRRKALGPAPPDPTPNSGPQAAPTIASPASQAAKPTPAPTPAPGLPVSSPKSDPQWGTPNDPGSAKGPAANDSNANNHHADADLTPAISPTSTRDSSNKDSHTDKNPPVVAANPAQDPASIKDSASSDSSTDNDPADIVQKPTGNPASAKEPFNDDPPANKDPVVVAQKFENDQSGSQDTYSRPPQPAAVPAASVTTIADHRIQVLVSQPSESVVVVDGQSITAGHDPTAISSTQIALHINGDLVLGTSTVHNLLPTIPAQAPFVTTAAGHSIQVPVSQPSVSVILVDGQPITAGASPTTLSSTFVALHTNGDLVLGTSTIHNLLPTNPPVPAQAPFVTTAAGHSILIAPSQPSVVMVDGQPITAGASPMTVSSTPIALHTNGDLILGTSTLHNILPTAPPASPSYFTVGSQTITLSSSQILAVGTTHAPGDPAFVIDNTIISLGSSALHIGSSAIPISAPPPPALTTTTAAGHLLTLLPSGIGIVVSGTTLTPNAPAVTLSSTLLSYGPHGFVAGTSTIPLIPPTTTSLFTTLGQTFTALPSDAIAVAGITLTSNAPAVTVSGEVISLGANGLVVNGTATISLPPRVSATEGTLGGFIDSGNDGGGSNATRNGSSVHGGGNVGIFSGDADKVSLRRSMWIGAVMALWSYYVQ